MVIYDWSRAQPPIPNHEAHGLLITWTVIWRDWPAGIIQVLTYTNFKKLMLFGQMSQLL